MDSKRMEEGIKLINSRTGDVPTFALKVLRELGSRQSSPSEANNLSDQDAMLWKTLHYFFQQAAFTIMKPSNFSIYLENKGINKELSNQLAELWSTEAKAVVDNLKKQTILPQVTSVETSIHYHIAGTAEAPTKSPLVVLDLGVEQNEEKSSLTLEFNREELVSFYKVLEEIQASLDNVL